MLKSGVVLFYIPMGIIFDKTFKRPKEMVELLKDKGLTIDDPQRTEHYQLAHKLKTLSRTYLRTII